MALDRQELLKGEPDREYQCVRLVSIEQPAEIGHDQRFPLPPVKHPVPEPSRSNGNGYVLGWNAHLVDKGISACGGPISLDRSAPGLGRNFCVRPPVASAMYRFPSESTEN